MNDKLKPVLDKVKSVWGGMSKRIRTLLIVGISVILVGSIALAVVLNIQSRKWLVLFPGMTTEEASEVYLELKNMEVETKLNSKGEIEVKKDEWDDLVYRLAEKGYPQSAPSYGTFFDNLKMTMSEFEKKQTLRFELQDRIQTTLKRIDGVKGAIVTISLPEKTNYVWKKDDADKATASVMLTLDNPDRFTADQVSAIKNIVAYSAQQVKPEDVSVVNAATGVELLGLEEASNDVFDDQTRMNYLNMIKNQYEENARRILAPIYGEGEVIAVASVDIDYDKVNEEVKEYLTNEENEGVKSDQYIRYEADGVVDPGGIVGEEDNTDIPNYGNLEDDLKSTDTPEYERKTEWAIGYILTQKEKAQGAITDASISVVVTTETGQLTGAEQENIIQLVRNATNIDVEKISASARLANTVAVPDEIPGVVDPDSTLAKLLNTPWFKWVLLGAAVLLIILITLIIIAVNKNAKKKIALAEAENLAQLESMKKANEQEAENLKKTLEQAAKEHSEASNATANEVKEFAKKNPEIAAALIRSMMKG